jgi:hypothetical protein
MVVDIFEKALLENKGCACFHALGNLMRSQLFEGPKCESQTEDSGKASS